jgi:hypothetical protein
LTGGSNVKWSILPGAVIGVGLFLLGTSLVWSRVVSTRGTWTEAQAQELRDIGNQAHALHYAYQDALARGGKVSGTADAVGHHHEGVEVPEDLTQLKARLDEVLARRDRISAELATAQRGDFSLATVFWWAGFSLSGLGVVMHFIFKLAWARQMLGSA